MFSSEVFSIMSGIKDVAKLAGVSIATVSNVLNGTKNVSPQLTQKVMAAAESLSYKADPIARGMKSNKTGIIGVIVEDMCGVFYPYVVKGINSIASKRNYQLIICDAGSTTGMPSAFEEEKKLIIRLFESRVDGIILVSTVPENTESMNSYFEWLTKVSSQHKRTPIVSLERDFSSYGIDSIYYDGYNNAITAVNHLIQCGCKHIGCITGPNSLQIALDRTRGFTDCLEKNGLSVDIQKQLAAGNYTHSSGYRAMKLLLDNYPEIDGVFCENDQMATGALKLLQISGKKVPEDIKLIGYDDIFISSIVEPSLSTIHIQKRHAGIEAANILFKRIDDNNSKDAKAIRKKMPGRLVVRRSTVKNAPEDWILTDW